LERTYGKKKYCNGDESFDEWLARISGGNEEIQALIREKKFLFGGRILANRGLNTQGRKVSLSNCYVIAPPEDNIESILSAPRSWRAPTATAAAAALIFQSSPRAARASTTRQKRRRAPFRS
jgi:hypothetical protein